MKTAQIPYTDPYTDVPIWMGTTLSWHIFPITLERERRALGVLATMPQFRDEPNYGAIATY